MVADPSPMLASLKQHLASLGALVEAAPLIDAIAGRISRCLAAGNKVLTCGNGGSAAEALHLAEEMVGRFSYARPPLAAVCLAADPTAITCISNDFGYEQVFARQVAAIGRAGDCLVALSTSGRSGNILRALEAARSAGLTTLGLLGPPGSPAEGLCDLAFTIAGSAVQPAHIQEMHLISIHLILERLDHEAGASGRLCG
jgi:D-sedoheptulose 7-phosphate isomerase